LLVLAVQVVLEPLWGLADAAFFAVHATSSLLIEA